MKLVKVVLLALVLLGLTSVAGAELYWESDVLKDRALRAGQAELGSSMTEGSLRVVCFPMILTKGKWAPSRSSR